MAGLRSESASSQLVSQSADVPPINSSAFQLVSQANDRSPASSPAEASDPYPGRSLTLATALTEPGLEPGNTFLAQTNGTSNTNTQNSPSPPSNQAPASPSDTPPAPAATPNTPSTTSQDTTVTPGRAKRSGPSYLGVGGNFGVGSGYTDVGRTSFSVYSKIGLTRWLSFRPSVLIRNSATVLLPFTYDFSFGEGPTSGLGFRAAPFLGVGPSITTRSSGSVDLLLTGGVDIPLSSRFTATAAVNATVTGKPAVGIFVGVGYNFPGF